LKVEARERENAKKSREGMWMPRGAEVSERLWEEEEKEVKRGDEERNGVWELEEDGQQGDTGSADGRSLPSAEAARPGAGPFAFRFRSRSGRTTMWRAAQVATPSCASSSSRR
jgi:hypothetical protein